MSNSLLFSLSALFALMPAAVAPAGREERTEGGVFWLLMAVAAIGPAAWAAALQSPHWQTGVSAALWLSIAVSVVLFCAISAVSRAARRLAPLLLAYLIGLGVLAILWQHEPERPLGAIAAPAWFAAHILVAIAAYGLLTLAAVAGIAVVLRERALKAKRPGADAAGAFVRALPSVAEGEELQGRLLRASAWLLAAALASGTAIEWLERRVLVVLDHKTVLSLLTFALILVVVALRRQGGLSSRRAAHYVLVAYLLLTLAYPGVKFVTDVLLGGAPA
jgi:ABC-type uncharacterized transport system permease subunit